jgi:hypothetical protein
MDYTNTTENNQSPDESNFEFLKVLYGEDGTQRRLTDTSRRPNSDGSTTQQDAGLTRALLESQEEFDDYDDGNWISLHQNDFGAEFERDLGHGITKWVHLLLA